MISEARSYDAPVATRNVRHFAGCGIPVINPWETGPGKPEVARLEVTPEVCE